MTDFTRFEESRQKLGKARAEKWAEINEKYPDHAQFISVMSSVFGKPKRTVLVDLETGETVLDSARML